MNGGITCYLPCVSLIFYIPVDVQLDNRFAFMTACSCRRHLWWCIFKCANVCVVLAQTRLVLHPRWLLFEVTFPQSYILSVWAIGAEGTWVVSSFEASLLDTVQRSHLRLHEHHHHHHHHLVGFLSLSSIWAPFFRWALGWSMERTYILTVVYLRYILRLN